MSNLNFFLDTGTLIALSGLTDSDLQVFKNRIEASNSELSATHVQVDEMHENELEEYQQKIDEALKTLKNKGIDVRIEATKIPVQGIARAGHAKTASEEVGRFYNELRKEIDECERAKGTIKPVLNIARDAVIAVSSLGHDFFITCDRCLFDSWRKVVGKHTILRQQFKVPRVIYARRNPKEVAKQMLGLLPF